MASAKEKQAFIDSLGEITIFVSVETIAGLPSKLFIAGVFLTIYMVTQIWWAGGIVFGIGWFVVMYGIHADDDKALSLWVGAMTGAVDTYLAGEASPCLELKIIEDD